MTLSLVRRALLAAAIASPTLAHAQIIRGTVTTRGDTIGIPGVVVLLLDSTGATAGRALSDGRGDYRVVAPGAGTYRVRTMRVGFRPDTSAAIALAVGQEREQRLTVANVAAHLDTIRVVDKSQCRAGDGADLTAAVWDQARTALLAAQMTARMRSVNATIITYERTLDPNSERVREQSSGILSGLTVRPWVSLTPDSLRKVGYVLTAKDGSLSYLAPDLDALLSPNFVADHCFRVTKARDTTILGVSFEPGRDRSKIPEIEGTLWLDRRSADLKRLEFRYANVPREQSDRAGGDMEFVRMTNGGFAVSRWAIKMPVLERQMSAGRQLDRVAELKAVGGELSYAVSGRDTLYARAPLVLSGTLEDSLTRLPIKVAKIWLSGTNLDTAFADDRGKFTIPRVLPGEYTLEIRIPSYEVIGALVRWPLVFADTKTQPVIRLPSARAIMAARSGIFTGTVVDSALSPIAGADVALSDLQVMTLTDEKGAFRLTEVPPGAHDVSVRKVGFGPLAANVTFAAARTTDRKIVLTKLTVLDTVIVEAPAPLADFEANRKLGLGHFLTRDQLKKAEGMPMSTVLAQIPGLGLSTGRMGHAYILSSHSAPSLAIQQGFDKLKGVVPPPNSNMLTMMKQQGFIPPHIFCPEPGEFEEVGLKCGCYAKVYIDKNLMNPETPTRPFDVNTLPPEDIEGIEYYSNPSETPMRYQSGNATCGVYVIHRRRNYDKEKKTP